MEESVVEKVVVDPTVEAGVVGTRVEVVDDEPLMVVDDDGAADEPVEVVDDDEGVTDVDEAIVDDEAIVGVSCVVLFEPSSLSSALPSLSLLAS